MPDGWLQSLPSGRQRACIRIHGQLVRSRSYHDPKLAQEALDLLRKRKTIEEVGLAQILGAAPGVTFADAVDAWLREVRSGARPYSPRTLEAYEDAAAAVLARWERHRVAATTEAALTDWIGSMTRGTADVPGLAAATVRLRLLVLGWAMDAAVRAGWIPRRPCRFPKVRGRADRRAPLSEVEVGALVAAARRNPDPRVLAAILLAADAGLRREEILHLDGSAIRGRWLHLTHTKGRKERLTPILTDRLAAALAVLEPEPGERVLRSRPSPAKRRGQDLVTPLDVASLVAPAWRAALGSVPELHRLRHRFSSAVQAAGASTAEVRDWMGHSTIAVLDRYTHALPDPPAALGRRLTREPRKTARAAKFHVER